MGINISWIIIPGKAVKVIPLMYISIGGGIGNPKPFPNKSTIKAPPNRPIIMLIIKDGHRVIFIFLYRNPDISPYNPNSTIIIQKLGLEAYPLAYD